MYTFVFLFSQAHYDSCCIGEPNMPLEVDSANITHSDINCTITGFVIDDLHPLHFELDDSLTLRHLQDQPLYSAPSNLLTCQMPINTSFPQVSNYASNGCLHFLESPHTNTNKVETCKDEETKCIKCTNYAQNELISRSEALIENIAVKQCSEINEETDIEMNDNFCRAEQEQEV